MRTICMDLGLSSLSTISSQLSTMTDHCHAEVPSGHSIKFTMSIVQD